MSCFWQLICVSIWWPMNQFLFCYRVERLFYSPQIPSLRHLSWIHYTDRIISRNTEHYWPPYSHDLSPRSWLLLLGANHDSFMQALTFYSAWAKISVNNLEAKIVETGVRKMAISTKISAELCWRSLRGPRRGKNVQTFMKYSLLFIK